MADGTVNSRTTRLQWAAVAVLGIVSLWINQPSYPPDAEIRARGFETFALADSIVKHHSFADPFWAQPTGPSAHLAPLYPAYAALIIVLFGHGPIAVGVLLWSMAIMLALQQMILPFLSRELGLGYWTGIVAFCGWLAAGIPSTFVAENTFAGLLVIAAAWVMAISFSRQMSTASLLLAGILWGLLVLAQPVAVLVLAGWLVLLHFTSQSSSRQKILLALIPILIVSPWVLRNYVVFHRVVFVRDNLGKELAESNNPCASALWADNSNSGCFASLDPNLNQDEANKLRSMGEVEYNRMRLKDALNWISSNPGSFLELCARRFELFWFPPYAQGQPEGELDRPWILHTFTLLSIAGLVLMWRKARNAFYIIALWLVCFPTVYYFLQFLNRYRWTILWATFLPGSYALVIFVGWIQQRLGPSPPATKDHRKPARKRKTVLAQ